MHCTEFEAALQDAADRRGLIPSDAMIADAPNDLPSDMPCDWPALREHADACPRCRSVWRQLHFVDDALRGWGRQAFDVDLTEAVMARWRIERDQCDESPAATATVAAEPSLVERPGRSGHRLRAAVYAVAVASLLAVLIVPPWRHDPAETTHRPHPPDGSGQLVNLERSTQPDPRPHRARDTRLAVAAEQDAEPVPWNSLVESAGTAYRTVADDTAETWIGVKQLVSAWTPADTVDLTVDVVDMTGGATDEPTGTEAEAGGVQPWLDDLRRDWQPVGRDMTRPLEFLREAFPGSPATL